ncbi:MAG: hypothetical protein BGO49_24580 [Planctomycetales bacterium 71-10]|nr:MAG: hypothetical protein BGO49_24580 [Planctomycetales bacterium 71-10]
MSESQVINSLMRWLYLHGLEPIRNNTGAFKKTYRSKKTGLETTHFVRVGRKGSGDILVCGRTGRWIEIEAKDGSGVQRPEQIDRQRHVEALGGVYILARSIDDLENRKDVILGASGQNGISSSKPAG